MVFGFYTRRSVNELGSLSVSNMCCVHLDIVRTLSNTTCAKSAISKGSPGTLRRASPAYFAFKTDPQLTSGGYTEDQNVHKGVSTDLV